MTVEPFKVAALFVDGKGVYRDMPNVDLWDEARDARRYCGPWPVVAHPPCARWGRYWSGGPSAKVRMVLGDDGGCFASALVSVRKYGGVIEHPEASHAWPAFGLRAPEWNGGWIPADDLGGYTCCVSQGAYGHAARKLTWLYVYGIPWEGLPLLKWGTPARAARSGDDARTAKARRNGLIESCLGRKARAATPVAFAELLIRIARQCDPHRATPIQQCLGLKVACVGVLT